MRNIGRERVPFLDGKDRSLGPSFPFKMGFDSQMIVQSSPCPLFKEHDNLL